MRRLDNYEGMANTKAFGVESLVLKPKVYSCSLELILLGKLDLPIYKMGLIRCILPSSQCYCEKQVYKVTKTIL